MPFSPSSGIRSRGGMPESGVFVPDPSPFAALLGYDVRATYRNDTTKTDTTTGRPR